MVLRKNSAFTMMEILVVLIIIGALMAILGPKVSEMFLGSKKSTTKLKMAGIKDSLLRYNNDMGHFPSEAEGGLRALVELPRGLSSEKAQRWQGPYAKGEDALEDAWKVDFEYLVGKNNLREKNKHTYYEIISTGSGEDIIDGV
ncbi:MAG: type II secretion system protein GspG [Candidatus Babeliales bacterium]